MQCCIIVITYVMWHTTLHMFLFFNDLNVSKYLQTHFKPKAKLSIRLDVVEVNFTL